ncbi:MAG: hypothetical protein ACR2FY_11080 [Pirellulaceae bacterium]
MKLRYLVWVLVPLLIGLSVYAARRNSRSLRALARIGPVLECPETLDLGERELGEVALSRFTVANRGGGQLEITAVRSNCSCTGLEQELEGVFVRVESLRLSAGEKAELLMRVVVTGTPGRPTRNGVRFRTNDPDRPEMSIEAAVSKVKAGVTTIPTSASFGTLPMGAEGRQVLDVYDSADKPRAIERVVSRNPNLVSVRILPTSEEHPISTDRKLGVQIGRLEVIAVTTLPGPLTNEIEIYLQGEYRPPTVIEVSGRVAAAVEVSPSFLVLPRASEAGPIYFGECVCRSTDGKKFTLTADSPQVGLNVELETPATDSTQGVRIQWDPKMDVDLPPNGQRKVCLRANVEGRETILEVRVFCRRQGAS